MLEIPPHIWSVILPYTRNPRPSPLSRPLRCELKQPHLAVLKRTCKLFNSIAESLLYTEIVTDHLPSLLVLANSPNKLRQYSKTTSLFVEYTERQQDPTYCQILGFRSSEVWENVGDEADIVEQSYMLDCRDDTEDLIAGLKLVKGMGMKGVFPKLKTVAVGSIYGRQTGQWKSYQAWHLEKQMVPNTLECSILWDDFLASGSLRHLCQRDPAGPLNIGGLSHISNPNRPKINFTTTHHFSADFDMPPLPLGRHIDWISDAASTDDWSDTLREMGEELHSLAESRADEENKVWPDVADVDIYCSTSYASPASVPPDSCLTIHPAFSGRTLTLGEQKVVTTQLGDVIQDLFTQQSQLKDTIRWHPSAASPRCPACGSGPPA